MLEIGKTRYGTPIVLRWHLDETGTKIPVPQEFTKDTELFDAAAVYSMVAARMDPHDPDSDFAAPIFRNANYYEGLLGILKNADDLAADLNIKSAFDRARYAESLINIAFK